MLQALHCTWTMLAVHCCVLQCVAACWRVVLCVAVWCSVVKSGAEWCHGAVWRSAHEVWHQNWGAFACLDLECHVRIRMWNLCNNTLQHTATTHYNTLQHILRSRVSRAHSYVKFSQCVAVRCSVSLQCVAVWCCSVLQCDVRIHVCGVTHTYVWHDACVCVVWLIYMCDKTRVCVWHDMTHSYVWHDVCVAWRDPFICVTWRVSGMTWPIHMCDMPCVQHDLFILSVSPWLICVCEMAHSYMWHGSFIHVVTSYVYMNHVTCTHDSFIHVTWFMYKYDVTPMTHSYSAHHHDSFIYVSWLIHICNMPCSYGVATISRLLKIICLFCKRALLKRRYSAKETYDFKELTNRSHPIHVT